jgi:hypothetical protein
MEDTMPEVFEADHKRITLIDLSDCLENATAPFEPNAHTIEYITPEQGVVMAEQRFGLGPTYWPDGLGWAAEQVTLTTHSGTHVDAPAHYGPSSHGQARTIDQVPLRWCFSDGVILNMTHKQSGEGITREDAQGELARIGYTLKPYDAYRFGLRNILLAGLFIESLGAIASAFAPSYGWLGILRVITGIGGSLFVGCGFAMPWPGTSLRTKC